MADSVERINELLAEAKAAREVAEKDLAETQAKVDMIENISIDADLSLPKANEKLEAAKANYEKIKEFKAKAQGLINATDLIIEGIAGISDLRKFAVHALYEISELDKNQKFEEAFAKNDELEEKARSFQSEVDLIIRRHLLEITAWNRCALWNHLADVNVANGTYSLSQEEFQKYVDAVASLPMGFHTEESRAAHQDKIFGFRCYDRGLTTLNSPRSLEDLQALLALLDEANQVEKHLPATLERIAYLHGVACEEYNRLADQFFDLDRNFDRALDLFRLRGYFEEDEIVHDDYRLAKDETDFRLRFLDKEALRMTDSEFSVAVYAYADSIQNEEETEFEILCRYALINGISDDKVAFLASAVNRLSFQVETIFLGTVLERGLAPERQEPILNNLIARKDKTLDLEKSAKALLNCKTMLDEPLRPAFEKMLQDLLRSPHARKVVTKSVRPEAHALIGEDLENFNRPWGKAIKNPVIKSWDFFNKAMFVAFAVVLPAIILAAGFAVIYALLRNDAYVGYYLLAPLGLALILVHLLIVGRFGIDERGSAVYRRTLGLVALACAIFSLVYFVLPGTLAPVRPFAFMALIFAGVAGLWGFFAYADKKKKITAFIYVPLLLITIASVIMMVVGMINGTV